MRKIMILFAFAIAGFLPGCNSDSKTPAQKEAVLKNWNDARSAVLISLAADQYKNANFDKARVSIDEAMALSPDSASARLLSARLYIEAGQLEAAERDLAQARQLSPASAEADYLSGIIYQRWQQPERALEFYQHACDKAPAELAYLLAKAEMLVAMDRRGDALSTLQQRVTYFEHSGAIRDEVGLLMFEEGRYSESVEMFRHASILSPDDLTILEHLASALYFDKQYTDCSETLAGLLKDDHYSRRADLMLMLGECQMQTGRADQAEPTFQNATEIQPDLTSAWLSLAKVQLQLGRLRAGEISARRALALEPANSQVYLLIGYLNLRQSRYQDALEYFTRANQLDPADTVTLCMIGLAQQKLGRGDLASAALNRALKINPTDEMATQLMSQLDSHE